MGYLSILGLCIILVLVQTAEAKKVKLKNFFEMVKNTEKKAENTLKSKVGLGPGAKATYTCTNGKNPKHLSNLEYLTEFGKGPCAPVILIPGISGSVLVAEIDCPALKQADPKTFEKCGWKHCKSGLGSPSKEYRVWIGDYASPMTLLSPLNINKACFRGLVHQNYTKTADGKLQISAKTGVKISPLGRTPKTSSRKKSACGINGIQNLVPSVDKLIYPIYYSKISKRLKKIGYKAGLTMTGLPYDFRIGQGHDDFYEMLTHNLEELHKLTGKKVVTVAHSMGNSRTFNALWRMSQADKDRLIASHISIASALMGSPVAFYNVICATNAFHKFLNLGLDFKTFKDSAGSFESLYELNPSRTYSLAKNEPWMKEINQRIAYDNGKSTNPGEIDFLPTRDQTCYPNFDAKQCRSGLADFRKFGTYDGKEINTDNYRNFVNDHGMRRDFSGIWDLKNNNHEATLPNPGVQVNFIYSSVVDTKVEYNFKKDPRTFTDKNSFCSKNDVQITKYGGDGSLPTTSVVTPAYKWALDFKAEQPNAKPVKLVDICSTANEATSPYDSTDSEGVKHVTKNGYIGLPCSCKKGKAKGCNHSNMLYLPEVSRFIHAALQTGETKELTDFAKFMTTEALDEYVDKCKAFNPKA